MTEQKKEITAEEHIEALETKITALKVRVFDLAENTDHITREFQAQSKQLQEFVTSVMTIAGMEMIEQVQLSDVIEAVEALVTPSSSKGKVLDVEAE